MQDFKKLKVWQRSHALVLNIHKLTKLFPPEERYDLVPQLRRAAKSVPTNIAEGCKRESQLEFARFLNIAEASLSETEYHILLSHDLDYLPKEKFEALANEIDQISRMLSGLRKRIKKDAKLDS